jgi:hypothetical protein
MEKFDFGFDEEEKEKLLPQVLFVVSCEGGEEGDAG